MPELWTAICEVRKARLHCHLATACHAVGRPSVLSRASRFPAHQDRPETEEPHALLTTLQVELAAPRPWASEFFSKLGPPPRRWASRLKCNLYYYRTNYILLALLPLLACFLLNLRALLALGVLLAALLCTNDPMAQSVRCQSRVLQRRTCLPSPPSPQAAWTWPHASCRAPTETGPSTCLHHPRPKPLTARPLVPSPPRSDLVLKIIRKANPRLAMRLRARAASQPSGIVGYAVAALPVQPQLPDHSRGPTDWPTGPAASRCTCAVLCCAVPDQARRGLPMLCPCPAWLPAGSKAGAKCT